MVSKREIPVYRPSLLGKEREYVDECLTTGWISSKGRFVPEFEAKFAERVDAEHATSVCNGTVALHLALVALGIGPGDEVIVPTLTYIASVNAITYTGAVPVFVDSLPDTWQMDPEDVRRKLTPNTKAIMAVHLYGHPCDMDALTEIADDNGLFLIEDAAEAFGSKFRGRHAGSFGDISCFSFYGNKTITTGEGGMVVTDDDTLYDRSLHFKGQGLAKHREYWHDIIGYNYRMTNICAAIGLAQMEQADSFLSRKREIARMYEEQLTPLGLETHKESSGVVHSFWMCSMLVNSPGHRTPLREHLSRSGIETRPVFYPIHTMPMYSARYQRFKVAENIAWRGINLPSFPALLDDDVMYICDAIKDWSRGDR
jgi:perosamine synthetase